MPWWSQLTLAGDPSEGGEAGGEGAVEDPSLGIEVVGRGEHAVARYPGSALVVDAARIEAAAPPPASAAPRSAGVALALSAGVEAVVRALYVSGQLADPANTVAASVDGQLGRIAGRVNLDAQMAWRVNLPSDAGGLRCFIAAKNLTNQVYAASRSPAGIQRAGFFIVLGGVDVGW